MNRPLVTESDYLISFFTLFSNLVFELLTWSIIFMKTAYSKTRFCLGIQNVFTDVSNYFFFLNKHFNNS